MPNEASILLLYLEQMGCIGKVPRINWILAQPESKKTSLLEKVWYGSINYYKKIDNLITRTTAMII